MLSNVNVCKTCLSPQYKILCLPQPGASRSLLEKMMVPEVSQNLNLNTHTGSSVWQISFRLVASSTSAYNYLYFVCLFLNSLIKVLSDKALPVLCLFAILVYWTLGLSLPSTGNLLEEDVSQCVSLF